MHRTLTDLARCLHGDEHGSTPACELDWEHQEFIFIERLTFAGAEEILTMLRTLCPQLTDGRLPVRARNLAYRLLVLQRLDDPALMREAADSLSPHGPDWDDIAEDLKRRADALDPR
ncbi:hypothetical protein ACWD4P_30175 [Kitasatospora sp. NPDC002543]